MTCLNGVEKRCVGIVSVKLHWGKVLRIIMRSILKNERKNVRGILQGV